MKKNYIALIFVQCISIHHPVLPQRSVPLYIDECISAEQRLIEKGCIIREDKPFANFCMEAEKNKINLHTKCLSNINSCEDVSICWENL